MKRSTVWLILGVLSLILATAFYILGHMGNAIYFLLNAIYAQREEYHYKNRSE